MTTIAAVHVDPRYTVPAAIVIAVLLIWYWRRAEVLEAIRKHQGET